MNEIINIPDENFRKCILKQLNKPSDYKITKEDCMSIKFIDCCLLGINSLQGIEYFTNLFKLMCLCNNLTFLDLSKNVKLKILNCSKNQLINLDLSKNIELSIIACNENNLTRLDLSRNIKLRNLFCNNNTLTSLDLSKNIELIKVYSKNNNRLKMFILNDFIQKIINYTPVITNFKNITIEI